MPQISICENDAHSQELRVVATTKFSGPSFEDEVSRIGGGPLGTKVETLLRLSQSIRQENDRVKESNIRVSIPHMHVIATAFFDQFINQNNLYDLPFDQLEDREIAQAFIDATLPAKLELQIYALIEKYGVPLTVRASRLTPLPFSHANDGMLHCKMVPNNQPTLEQRLEVLKDAIKLIYASSFYTGYRDHLHHVGQDIKEEKTAVIIQEVVGEQHGDLFHPVISGTSYSYNFYAQRGSGLHDGSASLVFGLGKGCSKDAVKPWCYSHKYPAASAPFNNSRHKIASTQNCFFAIDMTSSQTDRLDAFEYIKTASITDAEKDPAFKIVASTFDALNDRFTPGIGRDGARVLDFSPLLVLKTHPLNEVINRLRQSVEDVLYCKVAIEFAIVQDSKSDNLHIHLLEATPLFSPTTRVKIENEHLHDPKAIIASEHALGNGVNYHFTDIVFVDPEAFKPDKSQKAVQEVAAINRKLARKDRRYILVSMGRIGTSDPYRGLNVAWHQISGARVFIETDLPDHPTEFSHGNHFFSDLVSCGSFYFHVPLTGELKMNFDKLKSFPEVESGKYVRHVCSPIPLKVMVDGRTKRGIVVQDTSGSRA